MKYSMLIVSIVSLYFSSQASSVAIQPDSDNEVLFSEIRKDEPSISEIEKLLKDESLLTGMKLGWLPLHYAAKKRHLALCYLFISKGADVNACILKNKVSPLHIVCGIPVSNDEEKECVALVVKLLTYHGALVDLQNAGGCTPLHSAVQQDNRQAVSILLEQGATTELVNKQGETPLHIASAKGHYDIVQLLLSKKASVYATDSSGETPLDKARQTDNSPVVTLLKKKGALSKEELRLTREADTPIIVKTESKRVNPAESDASVKQKLSFTEDSTLASNTKLHSAVQWNKGLLQCEQLIRNGVGLDAQNIFGKTALHNAAERGQNDVCEMLLQAGASAFILDENKRTPLELAAIKRKTTTLWAMLGILMNHSEDIDIHMLQSTLEKIASNENIDQTSRKIARDIMHHPSFRKSPWTLKNTVESAGYLGMVGVALIIIFGKTNE